jgi:hypothetical protein
MSFMVMSTYQGDLYRLLNPGPRLPRRILEADELLRVVDAGVIVLDAAHSVKVLHRYAAALCIHAYLHVKAVVMKNKETACRTCPPSTCNAASDSLLRPLGYLAWGWPELIGRNRKMCLLPKCQGQRTGIHCASQGKHPL